MGLFFSKIRNILNKWPLTGKSANHGFTQIVDMTTQWEKATEEECDMIKIMQLTSELMKACGSKEALQLEGEPTDERHVQQKRATTNFLRVWTITLKKNACLDENPKEKKIWSWLLEKNPFCLWQRFYVSVQPFHYPATRWGSRQSVCPARTFCCLS